MLHCRRAVAVLAVALIALSAWPDTSQAQDRPRRRPNRPAQAGGGAGGNAAAAGNREASTGSVKPYDEVITDKAETRIGLFRVHTLDDKLYYEIPANQLGSDMLWVTSIAGTTAGASYAGMPSGDRVIRWEQRGEKILLRDVRYNIRADTKDSIALAVEATNIAPIIKAFDVKAYGKDKAPVIEVTSLFTSDVDEFSVKRGLSAGNMDSRRSFIEYTKAFPTNVEVRVLATYNQGQQAAAGAGGRRGGFGGGGAPRGPITAMVHHSMVRLPDNPMTPRVADRRVGFFSVGFSDYADDSNHEVEPVRYITRWRLEKKDPAAEVSDPVKPIVFYVAREVPDKWKPYVKAGVDQWAPVFEAAGFSNAIMGKLAPDAREDPDWDAEDARISSIRWLPSDVANAFGPHVHDPRTGEILEADVRMFHNVTKLVRDWYFVQCGATDERAATLPLPDELMGELIQFVVAHEVGHSLGLPHNFKSSSTYTIEQLRSREWTEKNGTAPSIMDYARFNYVAQPGDDTALMAKIGPYDYYSINWGYRQFPRNADEAAELEALCKLQIDEPMYRFGGGGDPTAQTEDLSNDAVEATRLGLLNLERIADRLVEATCAEGEDYGLLNTMYDALFSQFNREMGHVANYVGGVEEINLYYGDADQRYFPVSADTQREAARFLIANALTLSPKLTPDDVIGRLTRDGVADKVLTAQSRVLSSLVNARRINRMSHLADSDEDAYTPAGMLADIRKGVFGELNARGTTVGLYRRNLQRTYIDQLAAAVGTSTANSDLPALARYELQQISAAVGKAKATDAIQRAHLSDLQARIQKALDDDAD